MLEEAGSEARLGCTISDPATQVGPSSWAFVRPFVVGFATESTVRLEVGKEQLFIELVKGVDFPQSKVGYSFRDQETCFGKGSRVLSGVSFSGRASGASEVTMARV